MQPQSQNEHKCCYIRSRSTVVKRLHPALEASFCDLCSGRVVTEAQRQLRLHGPGEAKARDSSRQPMRTKSCVAESAFWLLGLASVSVR